MVGRVLFSCIGAQGKGKGSFVCRNIQNWCDKSDRVLTTCIP